MSGSPINSQEPALPTGGNPEGPRGLQTVVRFDGFRRLWIGQIFSQLADKFYIVLMVYLIAQYWVTSTPQDNGALAEIASAIRMDFETRAQRITLLATGVYVANTIPAGQNGA